MNTSKRLSFGGCCAAAMLVWAVASPLVGQPLNRTNLTPKESVFAELNDSRFLDRQAEWGTRCKTPDPNCAPLVILDWDCRNLPNPNPNETPEQCVARKFKVYQQLAEAERQADIQFWEDAEKEHEKKVAQEIQDSQKEREERRKKLQQEKREREQQASASAPGNETSKGESSADVASVDVPNAASNEVSEDDTAADTSDVADEPVDDSGDETLEEESSADVDGDDAPDTATDEASEDETAADTTDVTDEPVDDSGDEETDTELASDVSDDSSDESDATDDAGESESGDA